MADDVSGNPLRELLNGALSRYDFGVLEHGFAPHGRDYRFVIQDSLCSDPGTYELVFTHVVDLKYETRVRDTVSLIRATPGNQKGTDMPTQSTQNAPQLSEDSATKTIAPAKASTPSKIDTDPRLDPRIKMVFAGWPAPVERPNVSSREELLAQENSPAALAALAHRGL